MRIEDMVLISVDDHVVEPPDTFERHVPRAYRDRAPRIVKGRNDEDMWEFEGQLRPNVGLNAVAGRPPEEYGFEPTSYAQMRPGCYDIHARVRDMDAGGIATSMCFGSFPSFCGKLWAGAKDKDLALACLRAYNDWHIEDWCGAYPGRFIPLAQLPLWDIGLMVDELHRVHAQGCRAVILPENPTLVGLPSIHQDVWDPFWRACCDSGVTIAIHIGSAGAMTAPSPDAPVETVMAGVPIHCFNAATDLVFSSALRRFPDLRIALSEGGIGWVPYFLERIDAIYARHHAWTGQDFGDERPSDLFRRHFLTCFIDDHTGIRLRDLIGVDRISWECDYPHSDTTWPQAPEALLASFAGVSDAEIDQITHGNAIDWFGVDPRATPGGRAACNVGALRARAGDVDLAPRAGRGGKPPAASTKGPVTASDVMRQLATALDGGRGEAGQR